MQLRPGISLLGWTPSVDPGRHNDADLMMDVITDPAAVLPGHVDSVRAAVAWSTSSVLAERLAVGGPRFVLRALGYGDVAAFTPIDAAAIFDAAKSQAIDLAWLGPHDESAAVSGSAEAVARIAAHLAGGRYMLVPRRPVTIGATALLGWWMIDPATGQLRNQLGDGRHAEFVKKEITEEPARIETPAYRRFFQKYGQCLRAAAVALDLMLESGGAGKAERAAQKLKDEMTQRSTPASGKGGGSCGPA